MLNTKDSQVKTAVEFLAEVYLKGHKESELRKYLFHNRHMTTTQIDMAFEIHAARIRAKKELAGEGERPEVTKTTSLTSSLTSDLAFLLPENRDKGRSLLKHFLKTEFNYCNVLKCLSEEYYNHLCELSDRGKIKITRKEIEPIFHGIPQLVKFHKAFYQDMRQRKGNFGQYFVRQFTGFRDYLDYVKDCNFATKKMREYIHDKKLRKCLDQTRQTSRRPNDDLMDLLLSPLDRIKTYKEFLDNLREWADKTQEPDYGSIETAARRIGRIVDWIEMYKHTIINRNEMNKVQQFLDKQCTIISPNRRIVRRGLMTRRTTTWPVRNKHYVFFLFNDVLLWTTRKGELQNLVFLRDSEIKPSTSKTNQKLKFEVIADGRQYQYHKHLKLECKEIRQRNEWYNAIEKEINLSKKLVTKETASKPSAMEEDLANYIAQHAESRPDFLTPPPDTANTIEKKTNDSPEEVFEREVEEEITNPGHRRYQHSMNFEPEDFNGAFFAPDDVSVTSDNEDNLHMNQKTDYGNSMGALFPNYNGRKDESKESSNLSQGREEGRTEIFSRGSSHSSGSSVYERNNSAWGSSTSSKRQNSRSSSKFANEDERAKKTSIIRREETTIDKLRRQSSLTISLNDCV